LSLLQALLFIQDDDDDNDDDDDELPIFLLIGMSHIKGFIVICCCDCSMMLCCVQCDSLLIPVWLGFAIENAKAEWGLGLGMCD
jgi:hypothetical protein